MCKSPYPARHLAGCDVTSVQLLIGRARRLLRVAAVLATLGIWSCLDVATATADLRPESVLAQRASPKPNPQMVRLPPVNDTDEVADWSQAVRRASYTNDFRIESHDPPPTDGWSWIQQAMWQPLTPPADTPRTEASELGGAQSIGERPQDNSRLFLRRNTVLLQPGQWQFDCGLIYSLADSELPVAIRDNAGAVTGVARGRIRQRSVTAPFQLRYGLSERTQLFLDFPVGWAGTEFSIPGFDEFSNIAGMGDMQFGSSFLLKKGDYDSADFVGTFAMSFPTGNDSFPLLGLSPAARLGEGFFGMSFNLLWVKTVDPLVLFYGGGYRHLFDDETLGRKIDPGEQVTYNFGVGFAVNDRVTLSTSFLGAVVTANYIDGERLAGTSLEPSRLRFSATIAKSSHLYLWRDECHTRTILEPFAEIGMTNDAPAMRVGIVWTL